jgi:hypothetical protein
LISLAKSLPRLASAAKTLERVDVVDTELAVPRPVGECVGLPTAEAFGHPRGHVEERGLGVVGVHLVEVQEARADG